MGFSAAKLLLLVVSGEARVNEVHVGSRRRDPRAPDVDLASAFKPYPGVQGDRDEIPYIPASSWVGVLRHLLEKYYNLPAQTPRKSRQTNIIAPIHECKTLDEILKCPVCKIFARRDVVAWFDDMEPLGSSYKVQSLGRAGEYLVRNESGQLVAHVFVKDEIVVPRDIERIVVMPDQVGLSGNRPLSGEDLVKQGFRLEPIPRQVQVVSGVFKFAAKFDMTKLSFDDIKPFFIGLTLLEDRYVGMRGSRGYGRIEIDNLNFEIRDSGYYEEGRAPVKLNVNFKKPREILANWEAIKRAFEDAVRKLAK